MWASVCPECGLDVARMPPCRFCGDHCCPCVHEDEREAERQERDRRAKSGESS